MLSSATTTAPSTGDSLFTSSATGTGLFSTPEGEPQVFFATLFNPVKSLFKNLFKPSTKSYTSAQNSSLWSKLVSGTSSSSTRNTNFSAALASIQANAQPGDVVLKPADIESVALFNAYYPTTPVDSSGRLIDKAEINRINGYAEQLIALYNNIDGKTPEQIAELTSGLLDTLTKQDPAYALLIPPSLANRGYTTLAALVIDKARTVEELNNALSILDGQFEAPAPTVQEQEDALGEAQALTIKLNENPAALELPPELEQPQELSPYAAYGALQPLPLTQANAGNLPATNLQLTPETMGTLMPLSFPLEQRVG
jgi:hypothetical protein